MDDLIFFTDLKCLKRLLFFTGPRPLILSSEEYLIALFIGVVIFRFLRNSISSLASIPPELDTDDVVEISQSFICNKCGTELTINRQSVVANEPPKHCKDPMEPLD